MVPGRRMLMTLNSPYTVTNETLDSLFSFWHDPRNSLAWDCLFVSPMWMKAWWDVFGNGQDLRIYGIWRQADIIGIAPFLIDGGTARFVGQGDVCDYLDFIPAPGWEAEFFHVLITSLREQGITHLDLAPIHRDSTVRSVFPKIAKELKCDIQFRQEDVLFELVLPDTWDGYLDGLSGKYRHEIRRKLRRLEKTGRVYYRMVDDSRNIGEAMDAFLTLFRSNRMDKSRFMTDRMVSFFMSLAASLAKFNMLKLYFLELNDEPVASVMCFDYRSDVYLYNNGYDSSLNWLSIGLLSKLFSIKDSIQEGKKKYNFLKGNEDYKKQLGGKEIPVYRCKVRL